MPRGGFVFCFRRREIGILASGSDKNPKNEGLTPNFSLNNYFDKASPAPFDWAMTYAEVAFPIGANLFLGGSVRATYTGLDYFRCGIELHW